MAGEPTRVSRDGRGECGMARPEVTTSPEGTSRTAPVSLRAARQPPGSSEVAITVTYAGRPSRIATPLRWQRSSGARRETNGGVQRGTKLTRGSRPARQENAVFTTQRSGSPASEVPHTTSWHWIAPVTTAERGSQQWSYRPAGASAAATSRWSVSVHTSRLPPTATRSAPTATPIAWSNRRNEKLSLPSATPIATSWPAW
jgi:hypothetical protein